MLNTLSDYRFTRKIASRRVKRVNGLNHTALEMLTAYSAAQYHLRNRRKIETAQSESGPVLVGRSTGTSGGGIARSVYHVPAGCPL